MKTLTIGITTYNNDPFIFNLIYELTEQVRLNKRILNEVNFILYDDKSSKKDFLESIPDFIEVMVGEKNFKTPSKGRNYIINNSTSEYVLFIDGDDIIIRDIWDLVLELKSKSADILFSEVAKINAEGQRLKTPFIYSDTLMSPNTPIDVKEKLCVHQTGIWSIYKVSFLKKNLQYKLDMRYEDNYFLYNLLLNNPKIDILSKPYYGWRNNYKSFSYTQDSLKHRVFLYKRVMEKLKSNMDNKYAPYILYSIWNQTYTNIIRNYPALNTNDMKIYFSELNKVTNFYENEIKQLRNNIDKKYADIYFKYSKYKIFRNFYFIYVLKIIKRIKCDSNFKKKLMKSFKLFPINKRKIFLMSQYGEYGSNPKYFYKKIKQEESKKKIVFFVKDKTLLKNKDFKNYNNRLSFYYHFYTSAIIYFDTWLDPELSKKNKQTWNQMWHGYPYKKIYTDTVIYEQVNSSEKKMKKEKNILKWDNVQAVNMYNVNIFKKLFPSVNVINKEYDRVEWLINNKDNEKLKSDIRNKYALEKDVKYTLYAPTYRPYKVYLNSEEVEKLKSQSNELIYHPHPMIKTDFNFDGKILQKVDIQEILLVIDEMITDYSSIKYDFLQINKEEKLKLYEPDKELYEKIHGLY